LRILVAAFSAAIAVGLGACAPQAPAYPDHYEFGFMQACEAQGPVEGACACVWEKIEANIARSDFDALERMSAEERAVSPLQQQITGYVSECAADLAKPEGAPG
jgi:hypothetical protein